MEYLTFSPQIWYSDSWNGKWEISLTSSGVQVAFSAQRRRQLRRRRQSDIGCFDEPYHSKEEKEMSEERGCAPVILLAFLLGGVVGAGLALLLAPLSGAETRKRITDVAKEVKEKAEGVMEEIRDRVKEALP
jgi:hypothetical protein